VKTEIPSDLKEKVNAELTSLEQELVKKEPDVGKIQKTWNWLKENASWVVPIISTTIIEGLKAIFK
jgi:hypothetical protein